MIKSKKVKKAVKAVTDKRLQDVHSELQKLQQDHEMLQMEHDFEKRQHKMTKMELSRLTGKKKAKDAKAAKSKQKGTKRNGKKG